MSNFFKGAALGFIGGFFVGKKKQANQVADMELRHAEEKFQRSSENFKDALQSFEGNTLDEKYSTFLDELHNADFSHLDPDYVRPSKIKKVNTVNDLYPIANIFIHREGQNYGPYKYDQIQEYIDNDTLSLDDLAWHDGYSKEWKPIAEVIVSILFPDLKLPPTEPKLD